MNTHLPELLPFACHLYKKVFWLNEQTYCYRWKKKKLRLTQIKLSEHREDKIFNFLKKGTQKKKKEKI